MNLATLCNMGNLFGNKLHPRTPLIDWTEEEIDIWAEHIKREEARKDDISEMLVRARNERMIAIGRLLGAKK